MNCSDPDQRTAGLREAAWAAVRRGQLVVLRTPTVYGLGADAFSAPGIAAPLLTAKGRGRDMPVPVLVGALRARCRGLIVKVPRRAAGTWSTPSGPAR